MWPWEHLAIGYLAVSLVLRGTDRPLTTETFVVLGIATQFPDLVDKPLAWTFAVLPSGTTLAHSIFVAVPLSMAVILVCHYFGKGMLGVVFAVGYLLHLPGDILYGTVTTGQPPAFRAIMWPLVSTPSSGVEPGFLGKVLYFLGKYEQFLTSPGAISYVLFEAMLLGTALLLWRSDGYPGASLLSRRKHAG